MWGNYKTLIETKELNNGEIMDKKKQFQINR